MKSKQNFVIENGVLTKYTGPRRELTIPAVVTVIGDEAFKGRKGLTSVTIPAGVTTIDKSVFKNSRPVIIAPHIPVACFDAANKPGACYGFAKAYLDSADYLSQKEDNP